MWVEKRPSEHRLVPRHACLQMCLCNRSPQSKGAQVVVDELRHGVVSKSALVRPRAHGAEGGGPMAALQRLGVEKMCGEDKRLWLENARLLSITGTCRLSMPSVMSGLRCWISFVGKLLLQLCIWLHACWFSCTDSFKQGEKLYFPPDVQMLQAWAQLFRHEGTFANYLGYVRTGCMLADADCAPLDDPAVRRARGSIKKSQQFVPRERMWIRREIVEKLMLWSLAHTSYAKFAKLWLFTYAFLLRLPSEALPAVAGKGDHQSSVFMEGDTIVLVLKRRKNKPGGSRLVRTCWCSESKVRFCAWLRTHVFVLHGCMSGNMSSAPAWRNVARE
jgi:hypothetical protein